MSDPTWDKLKIIAERWIKEGWQAGNVGALDELHTPNFVDHSPAGRASDNAGFKAGVTELYVAFPDFYAVIDDLIIDPATGKITIRWSAEGTHKGNFMNIPPTERRIAFQGIEIIRLENERIIERWGEWDGIGLLQQLGVL